jgi:hypothetical protein
MSIRTTDVQASAEGCRCPISETAGFIVTIEGRPYASFAERQYAEQAVGMWLGVIDGAGEPIPYEQRQRRAWRGISGRKVEIVER